MPSMQNGQGSRLVMGELLLLAQALAGRGRVCLFPQLPADHWGHFMLLKDDKPWVTGQLLDLGTNPRMEYRSVSQRICSPRVIVPQVSRFILSLSGG